jgi:hypothetical protein
VPQKQRQTYLIPTSLKRWRRKKRGEHNELIVYVGGEPAVLQQYYRDEMSPHDVETPGKGQWVDIPLWEALLPETKR